MAHSNGVITAPVGIDADIAPVLGVGSYDLGYLCSNAHGKINKWSYIKPKEANTPDFNMGDFSEIADCYFGVYGELLTPKGMSFFLLLPAIAFMTVHRLNFPTLRG